jgi:uncharacterized protein (DUF1684 family)
MTLEHDHAAQEHEHAGHDHDHDHEDHAGHQHVDYPTAVAMFRADKDDYFRGAHDSPIPHDQRHDFPGLPYFDVDESMRFEGLTLEPYTGSEPTTFQIPTSDGQLRDAERAGTLSFDLGGAKQRLTGYRFARDRSGLVFLPFLDATSGTETYGAGRYLDLDPDPDDGTYVIDFNLAYHPTCVYDPSASCPLTPAENRLPVRIEAGERLAPENVGSA